MKHFKNEAKLMIAFPGGACSPCASRCRCDPQLVTGMATSKRKDFTQTALDVVRQAVGEAQPAKPTERQASGKKGGIVGGAARASKLTPEQRADIARIAAQARWRKTP